MNQFSTVSEELFRGRGILAANELMRLCIKTDTPSSKFPCEDSQSGTLQHVMIHDRWVGHIETCETCKEHIITLIITLHKRVNLFSPPMIAKMMGGAQ